MEKRLVVSKKLASIKFAGILEDVIPGVKSM